MAQMNLSQLGSLFKTQQEIIDEEKKKQREAYLNRLKMYQSAGQGLGPFQGSVQAWSGIGEFMHSYLDKQELEAKKNASPLDNPDINKQLILESYAQEDLTDPTVLRSLAKNLQSQGFIKEALTVAGTLQSMEQPQNEAVTAFTGKVDDKRVPLVFDKTTGAYKYRKDNKLVPYDGEIEYKPGSVDEIKGVVAAALKAQMEAKTGGGGATGVKVGKDGRPTGKVNPANLPPPAPGSVSPQDAVKIAEADRLKRKAIQEAERKRLLEEMTGGWGGNVAP